MSAHEDRNPAPNTFSLEIDCSGEEFQNRLYASQIMELLGYVRGSIATNRFSGRLMLNGREIGRWMTFYKPPPDQAA